jgi:hypothetical protein
MKQNIALKAPPPKKLIKQITRNVNNIGSVEEAGIAIGYGLDDREVGVRVPVGSRIVSSPRRPNRLWGPPNLLSNGYLG